MFTQRPSRSTRKGGREQSSALILADLAASSANPHPAESTLYQAPASLSMLGIAALIHENPDLIPTEVHHQPADTPAAAAAATPAPKKNRRRNSQELTANSLIASTAPHSKRTKLASPPTSRPQTPTYPHYHLIEFFTLLDELRLKCIDMNPQTVVEQKRTALLALFQSEALIIENKQSMILLKLTSLNDSALTFTLFDDNQKAQSGQSFAEIRVTLNQCHPVVGTITTETIASRFVDTYNAIYQLFTFSLGTHTPGFSTLPPIQYTYTSETLKALMSSKALIENAQYFFQSHSLYKQLSFSSEYVFNIEWLTKKGTQHLECRFYTNPYIYQQAENYGLNDKAKEVTSWVFSENEMLKDYSSHFQLTHSIQAAIKKRGKTKSKDTQAMQLRYFWLRVFSNNQEIIKLWLTFDATVGELTDLHSNAQMSGVDCLQLFDYLDLHFLKLKQTYICDDAGVEYPDDKDARIKHKLPFRVTFPLRNEGQNYYSKYSPGFKVLNCTERYNDHFAEAISCNEHALLQATRALRDMTLDKLSQAFLGDHEKILNKCITTRNLNLQTKKRARTFEPTKDVILRALVKQCFGEAQDLADITLKELFTNIDDASKKLGAGLLSTKMKQFNILLQFPWQSVHTIFSDNPFQAGSYYNALHSHLMNSRYLVRMGQKTDLSARFFQPAEVTAAAASASSAMDIDRPAQAASAKI